MPLWGIRITISYTWGGTQVLKRRQKTQLNLLISRRYVLSNLVKNRSNLTSHPVTCAYCQHQREYMIMVSELPFEGVEHMWCPKCRRDYKYDRGTKTALKLEDIQLIDGEYVSHT